MSGRNINSGRLSWQQYATFKALRLISKAKAKKLRSVYQYQRVFHELIATRSPPVEGPVTVVGLLSGSLGLGSAARRLVQTLREAGQEVYTIDLTHLHPSVAIIAWNNTPPPDDLNAGTLVFCINPPEIVSYLQSDESSGILNGKTLVGYWWWELEIVPPQWVELAERFDEIWSSSHFVYNAFARAVTRTRVKYIPPHMNSMASLVKPHRSGSVFKVLAAFDLNSFVARKNPDGAIAAFRMAFGDAPDKRLILKVTGAKAKPYEMSKLQALIEGAGNIDIVSDTLSSTEFAQLVADADVFLSLHRSEGLGLVLLEAMDLGVPVVATGWSGPMDFITHSTAALVEFRLRDVLPHEYSDVGAGCKWAEPSIEHAALWLRTLYEDPARREALGRRGQAAVHALYGGPRGLDAVDHVRTTHGLKYGLQDRSPPLNQ